MVGITTCDASRVKDALRQVPPRHVGTVETDRAHDKILERRFHKSLPYHRRQKEKVQRKSETSGSQADAIKEHVGIASHEKDEYSPPSLH